MATKDSKRRCWFLHLPLPPNTPNVSSTSAVCALNQLNAIKEGRQVAATVWCSLYFARCRNTCKTSDYENYSLVEEAEMEAGDWLRPSQKETARIRRLPSLLLFNHYITVSGVLMHIGMTSKTDAGSSLLNSSSLFHLCEGKIIIKIMQCSTFSHFQLYVK